MKYRSHDIEAVSIANVGEEVLLSGWLHSMRQHGEVNFIDLRDRSGRVQLKVDKNKIGISLFEQSMGWRNESVIRVKGAVSKRPEASVNLKQTRGDIEVIVKEVDVLNAAQPLPFVLNKPSEVNEALALKYRYLDLRRDYLRDIMRLRHEVVHFVRTLLIKKGFWEIETPILTKSTPEGARDFIVPSRHVRGTFYALPQSPQQYKELLMAAGVEKYFQIARCLRDEDARADRQIEHTQIDLEMSFVDREDVLTLLEELISQTAIKFSKKKIRDMPFPRLTYSDAIDKYGSDKPDLRFGMELVDLTAVFTGSTFPWFSETLAAQGRIKAIKLPGCANFSRKQNDDLVSIAKIHGADNLVTIGFTDDGTIKSSIRKFLTDDEVAGCKAACQTEVEDLIAIVAGPYMKTSNALGQLRYQMGKMLKLVSDDVLALAFVVDFPLFEWDEENKRYDPVHHMFTRPLAEDMALLDSDPLKVRSTQYDLVCNGYELCSGSIRINTRELQEKIMAMIGMDMKEAREKFGHLLEAFDYGTPPHGGAAPGLDRLLMILHGTENIRNVIAFPKSATGKDVMMDAPSTIDSAQLNELGIEIKR